MLLEEKKQKPQREAGKVIIMDWFSPRILTDSGTLEVRFSEVNVRDFVKEFNDYVAQGLKIYNIIRDRAVELALRALGLKLPREKADIPTEDLRFLAAGSLIYLVTLHEDEQEPIRVFKVKPV